MCRCKGSCQQSDDFADTWRKNAMRAAKQSSQVESVFQTALDRCSSPSKALLNFAKDLDTELVKADASSPAAF